MRLFLVTIFALAMCTITAQDKNVLLVIEQANIITGASVKYIYCDKKVRTYKKTKTNKYRQTSSGKISKVKSDSIDVLAVQLLKIYHSTDTIFSNPSILDGYKWTVMLNSAGLEQKFIVYNCYHKQLDDFIRIINGEIKRRNRLIFPTGRLYAKID